MPHNTFKQKSSSRPGYGGSSTQVKNKKSVNTSTYTPEKKSSSRPGYGGSSTNEKGVNTSTYTPKTPKPRNTGVNSDDNSNDDRKKTIKELDSLISRPKPKPPEETTTPKIKPKPKPPKEETTPKTTFKIKPKPKPKDEKDYSIVEKDYAYDKRFSRGKSNGKSTSHEKNKYTYNYDSLGNLVINSSLMSKFNTTAEVVPEVINEFITGKTSTEAEEIKFKIKKTLDNVIGENLSDSAFSIIATSAVVANIDILKKEFIINLDEASNITAKWGDDLSVVYNIDIPLRTLGVK
tara:strand:- start:2 stop:877 length:876 start_codon:yes stop_codon:yes gene_type:complete